MNIWMYYTTDGDSGYYNIKLFSQRIDAEIHKKNLNDAYGDVKEIEVFEKEEPIKTKSVYEEVECPECGGPMISRNGQYGTFWGCKDFPACKGTRDSQGRSKKDRMADRVANDVANSEWPRNEQDKIRWNKK